MQPMTNSVTSRPRIATVGTFDGVHRGHRALLDKLRELAEERGMESAVVTFVRHPRLTVRPDAAVAMLMRAERRAEAIAEAGIDVVVMLDFDRAMSMMSAREFVEMLRDNYGIAALLIGANNSLGHDRVRGAEGFAPIATETGVEIVVAGRLTLHGDEAVSSSRIRRLLDDGRPDEAAALLGHDYRLEGRVVHGKQLGRTIGFPTANIAPLDPSMLIPAQGVYACRVTLPDGSPHAAMVNIGSRPTVDAPEAPVTIEAHLLDYSGDLYGEVVALDFVAYLRSEQRFASLDALRRQLEADAAAAMQALASGCSREE